MRLSPIWRKQQESNSNRRLRRQSRTRVCPIRKRRRPRPRLRAAHVASPPAGYGLTRGRRETMGLLRDPIRLSFAFFGPLILMIAFGYGISLDVEHLRFAAFDQDRTIESRTLVDAFSSIPRYFVQQP